MLNNLKKHFTFALCVCLSLSLSLMFSPMAVFADEHANMIEPRAGYRGYLNAQLPQKIAGAVIELIPDDSSYETVRGVFDYNGIALLSPVIIAGPTYTPTVYCDGYQPLQQEPFTLAANGEYKTFYIGAPYHSISGTVQNLEGQALAGITVKFGDIVNSTDGNGFFRFSNLLPGNYVVEIEADGYNKTIREYSLQTEWEDPHGIQETIQLVQQPVNNSGTSTKSSGGGGGSRSPSVSDPVPTTHWIEVSEAKQLVAKATSTSQSFVRTFRSGPTGIRRTAVTSLKGLQLVHDTLSSKNAVAVRLTIPQPEKLTADTLLSAYIQDNSYSRTKLFSKYYNNKLRIVSLSHQGSFYQIISIAAKMNLDGMDINNLYFYNYDKAGNKYELMKEPGYKIDKNGYLHFNSSLGGDIIISEGSLQKK